MTDKVCKTLTDWKLSLNPEQYHICRLRGTEAPFSGQYYQHSGVGVYCCVCCGNELFKSNSKFESGTGWPSFFEPIHDNAIENKLDYSHGMQRMEVLCNKCEAHLGHVFDDGPDPTGLRYCINSVALQFIKEP